jgi:mannose-6-phosphate isomerase-like protein (cupin superfamily)
MKHQNNHKDSLILPSGQGRVYKLGEMTAIFKADENETAEKYSVSEWWLEPNSDGPGAHQHEDNVEMFYVLEGTMSFLVGDKWVDADKGTFLRLPAKTIHTFVNRTDKRTCILNIKIPGSFERELPAMVKWFDDKK